MTCRERACVSGRDRWSRCRVVPSGSCGGGWAGHGRQSAARLCSRGRWRAQMAGSQTRPRLAFRGQFRPSGTTPGSPRCRRGRRAAPYDPSVQPSSMIPPQTALDTANDDAVLTFSAISSVSEASAGTSGRQREDKERDAHASIAYDTPSQPVNEVPAVGGLRQGPLRVRTVASVGQDGPIPAHVAGDRTFRSLVRIRRD